MTPFAAGPANMYPEDLREYTGPWILGVFDQIGKT